MIFRERTTSNKILVLIKKENFQLSRFDSQCSTATKLYKILFSQQPTEDFSFCERFLLTVRCLNEQAFD